MDISGRMGGGAEVHRRANLHTLLAAGNAQNRETSCFVRDRTARTRTPLECRGKRKEQQIERSQSIALLDRKTAIAPACNDATASFVPVNVCAEDKKKPGRNATGLPG